ncbi:MAG: hypothetical protein ABIS36_05730 [Chryseolinea sp.]
MKHTFLTSAVLFVVCLGNLRAQDSLYVKSFVSRKFESEFEGASNVEWSRGRHLYVALFHYRDDVWLAFYNTHGERIACGRRLKSLHNVPLQVQLGIADSRRSVEQKYGSFVTSFIIELVQYGETRYYVPIESGSASMILCADNEGKVMISTKNLKGVVGRGTGELLASVSRRR